MNLKKQLLITGGDEDPNLKKLMAAAQRAAQPVYPLFVGRNSHPAIIWEMDSDRFLIDGQPLDCGAAFIRYDIFTALKNGRQAAQYRALAWHTTLSGWLSAHSEIRMFNRRNLRYVTNKPFVLNLAQSFGLKIPDTVITNDFSHLAEFEKKRRLVVKPVNGGGYCQSFDEVRKETELKEKIAAAPAIVQNRLVAPEIRVYAVGKKFFAFEIASEELDYRAAQKCRIEYLADFSGELTVGLQKLLDALGLDFAAADFKTCQQTGELVFLEVNTSPMFAAFDTASKGALCDSMLKFLISTEN
jgi:glutathione synthase/RimK-type ligase-like ATP-grasp enzyme